MSPPSAASDAAVERAPLVLAGARGVRYGPLPAELERDLARWLAQGAVDGGERFGASRAWRVDEWVIKFSGPRRGLREWGRPSPALRAAELALRLRSVRTPRPIAALERRRAGFVEESLLASEHVAGRHLEELWKDEPEAVAAFPAFLARMHEEGVHHGDLHPRNSIWDGSQWVLLDLEGLRVGLHRLLRRRLVEKQWARLVAAMANHDPETAPGMRALFAAYLERRGLGWPADPAWERIRVHARRLQRAAGLDEAPLLRVPL